MCVCVCVCVHEEDVGCFHSLGHTLSVLETSRLDHMHCTMGFPPTSCTHSHSLTHLLIRTLIIHFMLLCQQSDNNDETHMCSVSSALVEERES